MAKIQKTNVARLLDQAKVAYELIPYEVDENDLSAPHVAESLGEDIAQVFKTLILPMQDMWVRSLGWDDPLEEEMATRSSILAWEIPWTEQPGGLQSMGSQRVRQ